MEQSFAKSVKTLSFIVTRDRAKAKLFYGELLGFALVGEDDFAAVFDMNGIPLRVSTAPNHVAAAHTVLGWEVPDVVATVKSLRSKGVKFNVYPGLDQDELGIWKPPGGETQVAWFLDPDGNNLSVTQF